MKAMPPLRPAGLLLLFHATLFAGLLTACSTGTTSAGAAEDDEASRLVGALALRPGQKVADVGAGDGDWLAPLVAAVGPDGHVYGTEVDEDLVADIQELIGEERWSHVTALLGDDQQTGLPPGCCHAVLLRMVYHHFTDPAAMRSSLHAALLPGGRIAIVDIQPQKDWRELEGVPDRGGHGIPLSDLVEEMSAAGFEEVERFTSWNGEEDRFCVVFKKIPLP